MDLGAFLMLVAVVYGSGVTLPERNTRCTDAVQQLVAQKLEIQSVEHDGDAMTFVMASKSARGNKTAFVVCNEQGGKS